MKSNVFKSYAILAIVAIFLFTGSMANAASEGKIEICHKPGENNQNILSIPPGGVADHESHGDYLVTPEVCDGLDSDCDNPRVADNDVDCSDGIACTVDSCGGLLGCNNFPDDSLCDDLDPTTSDMCDVSAGCVNTTIQICGNGTLETPEECDDGNTNSGDGCSDVCTIEPICGNGTLETPEECDDGNLDEGDGCSAVCIIEEFCGDGIVDPGEQCDDGNAISGDGCSDSCEAELPPVIVTNLDDSGDGSLRWALDTVGNGGFVAFDPALAGGTVTLTSGPLVTGKQVTVDAASAPGITVSGGGTDRVLIVNTGADVTVRQLAISNGFGWQLGGGVINNGALTLDHVTVSNNLMATDVGDFWQGGGGIYNGEFASLVLVDSTVTNNTADWSGGGVYSFFNTSTTITRSTISNNLSNDVGGGLRLLSNADITNSTISGNQSTGWFGGALFLTDGVVNMINSTVADNVSPPGAPAAIFVGTFGPGSATLNLSNSIVAANVTEGCFLAPFGAGAVAINSLGSNVFSDETCFPVGSDQTLVDAGLGPLADNGGPTETQALLPGSPAIDAADNAVCPATDQRGVARDASCDVGAYEFVP